MTQSKIWLWFEFDWFSCIHVTATASDSRQWQLRSETRLKSAQLISRIFYCFKNVSTVNSSFSNASLATAVWLAEFIGILQTIVSGRKHSGAGDSWICGIDCSGSESDTSPIAYSFDPIAWANIADTRLQSVLPGRDEQNLPSLADRLKQDRFRMMTTLKHDLVINIMHKISNIDMWYPSRHGHCPEIFSFHSELVVERGGERNISVPISTQNVRNSSAMPGWRRQKSRSLSRNVVQNDRIKPRSWSGGAIDATKESKVLS